MTSAEAVWREHTADVLAALLRRSGDFGACEDVVQEALLAAAEQWPREGRPDDPKAWLVRVAKNKCVDTARQTARRPSPVADVPERLTQASSTDAGGHEIWEQVAALPEKQRLAVALHYFGGLSHAETAELTGSTPPAVRRASADGVAALRLSLASEEGTT